MMSMTKHFESKMPQLCPEKELTQLEFVQQYGNHFNDDISYFNQQLFKAFASPKRVISGGDDELPKDSR